MGPAATAISVAQDPVRMAAAFAKSVVAGRMAYEAGLANQSKRAQASSPEEGQILDDLGFLA